jgi:hypothetical protein
VYGGARLPWVETVDNFATLSSLDWQLHVYGAASDRLRTFAEERGLPLHVFSWNENAHEAGLAEDAAYLVRPDGYVGLASGPQDVVAVGDYLDRFCVVAKRPSG